MLKKHNRLCMSTYIYMVYNSALNSKCLLVSDEQANKQPSGSGCGPRAFHVKFRFEKIQSVGQML